MSDPAENLFCQLTAESLELWRGGWPDYFARHRRTGQLIGIEVKRGSGKVSPGQARMFEALEHASLSIFIWNPKTPRRLIPWRDYQPKNLDVKNCMQLEVLLHTKDWRRFTPAGLLVTRRDPHGLTLAMIREQQGVTQQQLARRSKVAQSEISRAETRDDIRVSTLKRYVAALGGKLLLHVEIDGHQYPVTL